MIKSRKVPAFCLILLSGLMLVACASGVRKADIPNTANPQDEIAKLGTDLFEATSKNIDVLAPAEFKNSVKWLDEAKSDLASKQKQEEIIDDLRKGRGYLESAYTVAAPRADKTPGLFVARQAALTAGAARHESLRDDLESLDRDVSSKADSLGSLDSEKVSKLQERYLALEKQATVLTHLGTSQAMFNGAKKSGAEKRAPQTFRKSELSLRNAESVIATNVRNPRGYSSAAQTAKTDATLLNDVMITIDQNGGKLSESAALKLVSQSSQIRALNKDLTASTAQAAASKAESMASQADADASRADATASQSEAKLSRADALASQATTALVQSDAAFDQAESSANAKAMDLKNQNLSEELKTKQKDLNSANASVETQAAMESARRQFTSSEAEAYQQGKNLVIRLKQMNFAPGRNDLSDASLSVLAKVSNVAKSMNASEIKVEGHTDSTGSETQNNALSEKRAATVASYFKANGFDDVKSEGHGFKKPIATNKSKEGRAQNRRVDIILMPNSEGSTN